MAICVVTRDRTEKWHFKNDEKSYIFYFHIYFETFKGKYIVIKDIIGDAKKKRGVSATHTNSKMRKVWLQLQMG